MLVFGSLWPQRKIAPSLIETLLGLPEGLMGYSSSQSQVVYMFWSFDILGTSRTRSGRSGSCFCDEYREEAEFSEVVVVTIGAVGGEDCSREISRFSRHEL